MKLGFVSAILDGWTFEEMMDPDWGMSAWKPLAGPKGKRNAAMRV